jgi:hypothetical protein
MIQTVESIESKLKKKKNNNQSLQDSTKKAAYFK